MTVRIISWNCRRAGSTHIAWDYFTELAPDIALLQEVTGIPQRIRDSYAVRVATPITRSGKPQRFQSMMLVRGTIGEPAALRSELAWVNDELVRFAPNLLAYHIKVGGLPELVAVGVHAPAWPVSNDRLQVHDVSAVKLTQNPNVWVADLLVAALKTYRSESLTNWILAGDFNSCESFDSWKGGPRGNREWLDRMAALGFVECLRHSQGGLTPTFRRPGTITPKSQIDHVFVSRALVAHLSSCRVGNAERVYGQGMSDHLPIVADFVSFDHHAV